MDLSRQQSAALDAVKTWFERGDSQVFRVFGWAGTGKTTIARQFADAIDGTVLFAAYTGKAAHVLREKGCLNAVTLHGLIYVPSSKSAERLRKLQREYLKAADAKKPERVLQTLREEIAAEQERLKSPSFALNDKSPLSSAQLLIIDEVSMVNQDMAEDLLSFGVKVLCLGDPAQLPPVKGGGYFTDVKPDVLLTEVHRQASDSPVLALATEVREGRGYANSPAGMVVPKGTLDIAALAEFDQVLVGTNRSRRVINTRMREHLGFDDPLPMVGDRLICTRNDSETGLLNGSQWFVESVAPSDDGYGRIFLRLRSVDGDEMVSCDAHAQPFLGEEIPYFAMREAQCFEYAYGMTVHKSQGSQWDSVVLIDESRKFPAASRRAWLYTGITRAAKDLKVIQ